MTTHILWSDEEYKIELDTYNSKFKAFEKEEGAWKDLKEFNTYKEAEEYLDNRHKRKKSGKMKKAKPLQCYKKNYDFNKIYESKITSIDVSDRYGFYVWVSSPTGRGKESLSFLFKFTEKNKKIFDEIGELKNKIKELESQMETFTEEEIKKHFQEIEK